MQALLSSSAGFSAGVGQKGLQLNKRVSGRCELGDSLCSPTAVLVFRHWRLCSSLRTVATALQSSWGVCPGFGIAVDYSSYCVKYKRRLVILVIWQIYNNNGNHVSCGIKTEWAHAHSHAYVMTSPVRSSFLETHRSPLISDVEASGGGGPLLLSTVLITL